MTSFYEELHKFDTISDEKENAQSRVSIDKWIFRLLLFLIGFMPLVVMANVEEVISPLVSNIDALSSGVKGDLFTHYKALLVLIITVITGTMLLVKVLFMGGEIRKTFLNYLLGLFVVVIVVSTIASPNISIALSGQYNRSEGAISWLCYIVLMFIAMNIEYPKNVIKYIMYTMIPFVYINLYIITMNFYGKDLLQNNKIQEVVSIILPEGAKITEGSNLVGTLNQWNYMSGMFAMMALMYLVWAIISEKWQESSIAVLTALASIAILFMSISTSGFLTFIISLPLVIVIIIIAEKKKIAIFSFIIFLIMAVPIFHILAEENSRVWDESLGFLINNNPYETSISLKDSNTVYASSNTFELPVLPERSWSLGTGRTYIWSETFNLLEERMILGYGADTLIYNFPHFKIGARAGMLDENTITDKAHNIFVGIIYGFGVLGLVAFLGIVLSVGIITLKLIREKKKGILPIAVAVLAYLIQGVFNDSLPSTTTIALIFLGIIFAIYTSNNKELLVDGRKN